MRYLSNNDVVHIYETLKSKAKKYLDKNELEYSMHLIEVAARWGYNYTFRYADDELEICLQRIAKEVRASLYNVGISQSVEKEERIVFVCNRVIENYELVQQYSRALTTSDIPTLMVVINRDSSIGNENIRRELQEADNIIVEWINDSHNYMDVTIKIASLICNFQPTRILAHVWPWDTRPIVAIMSAKNCPCYNINFNDHTFWIGKSMLDYLIEFRAYGSTISIERRGLKPEQLIHLPYYPIISINIPFQGFPFDRNGKIVIFTGGASYKMLGEDNLYFNNLDDILSDNSNTIVLLACSALENINKRVSKMRNRARVFITTSRKDITSLFLNSDIYYATYPVSGGLMSQYAAMLSIPIIAYAKEPCGLDEMDGIVNYHNNLPIAFHSSSGLRAYAKRLCRDKDYRVEEGKRLYGSMIKQTEFEKTFIDMMNGRHRIFNPQLLDINYNSISKFYLDYHNTYSSGQMIFLINTLRISAFTYFPQYIWKYMKVVLCRIYKKFFLCLLNCF